MAKIDSWEFPDELYYTKEHVWTRVDGDTAIIGLSSFDWTCVRSSERRPCRAPAGA